MADAEIAVCLITKHILPAMTIRTALNAVSRLEFELDLKPPSSPRLKMSNSPPKISPRIPASDSSRLVVRE